MISGTVLRRGLVALAEIANRKLDAHTESLWRQACRELNDDQFSYGIDQVLRTWKSTWMPPPGLVVEAGYSMPLPSRELPPIRPEGFWATPGQQRHVEAVAVANPKGAREGALAYIHRLAVLSGLVTPHAGETFEVMPHVTDGGSMRQTGEEG